MKQLLKSGFVTMVILSLILISAQAQVSPDDVISDYLKENTVAGFAACVIKGDSIIWSKASGYADVRKKIPMNVKSQMNIASISKTITATAIMQLWENGQLELNQDINSYLPVKVRNPNFENVPITINQLLTHTSSINDGPAYSQSYQCGDPVVSLKNWIVNYLNPGGDFYDKKQNFHKWKPSSKRSYSNVGYGLLGLIVEEISGKPFNEYCRTNIFDPLGMKMTGWFLNEIDTSNHTKTYINRNEKTLNDKGISNLVMQQVGEYFELCSYSFYNYPDGLLRTSVTELSYFLSAIMNNGEFKGRRILKENTVLKMFNDLSEVEKDQGLCWHRTAFKSLWGHSGGDPGVETYMYFDLKSKVGAITFQNSNGGDSFSVFKKIYEAFD